MKNNIDMNHIIKLLPILRNEILFFEESKKLYDDNIINVFKLVYKYYNVGGK